MSKDFYLPRTDQGKVAWLNNFSNKLPTHAATLGLTLEDQVVAQRGAEMFAYMVGQVVSFEAEKTERVLFKNLLRDGPIGSPLGDFPGMPVIPAPPASVPPGIFPRIRLMVQRIKGSTGYTEAIGADLKIIGAEQIIDPLTMKPVLKLEKSLSGINIVWKKADADAIRIEVDRDGQGFQFLAIDSEPDYMDTFPITIAATWKYRAGYLIHDQLIGQWSDIAQISVG